MPSQNVDIVDGFYAGVRGNVQQGVARAQIHDENENRPQSKMNCLMTRLNALKKNWLFPQKKVEPWKLYTMVSGLLAVDLVILLTWQLQDPLQRRLETFPLEDPVSSNDDVKIRPELEHCESHNNSVWLGEWSDFFFFCW